MSLARAALACLGLLACEKAYQEPPPPPVPRDARIDAAPRDTHFKIVYAARTDDAPDGTNDTFFNIVEDAAFFVITEGTTPDVSKAAAELMGELFGKECHDLADDDAQMRCVVERTTARLVHDHHHTSMAAVIVRGHQALVVRAGDTPVIWRHGSRLEVFDAASAQLGIGATPPQQRWIDLGRGDTLFIVNKRMLAVVGKDALNSAAPDHEIHKDELATRVEDLLTIGRRVRTRTDAVTALAIHLIHGD